MGGENETNPGQPGMGKWSKQGGQLGQEKRLEQGGQPEQGRKRENPKTKKGTVFIALAVIMGGLVFYGGIAELFLYHESRTQREHGKKCSITELFLYHESKPHKRVYRNEASGMDMAEEALQEKYGEEFIAHDAWSGSRSVFFADCSPKDNPNIVFEAELWKNGEGIFMDRYPHGILAEKVEDIVREEINGIYEDFFLKVYVLAGPDFPAEDIGNMKDRTPVELAQKMWLPKYLIEIGIDANEEKNYWREYKYFSQTIQGRVDREEILKIYISIYDMDTEMQKISEEYYSTHSNAMGDHSSRLAKCNEMRIECTEEGISLTYDEFKKMREELGNYER